MEELIRYLDAGTEVGCDEAGRGCLAGPVSAAAVCLPRDFRHPLVRDSKSLSPSQRERARRMVEREAIAWKVVLLPPRVIDALNILRASILAMQLAVDGLPLRPDLVLVDGHVFTPFAGLPYRCEIGGDTRYISIAAASILAKTHRDEVMLDYAAQYPQYGWHQNKGYPTVAHRRALAEHGPSPLHRFSFHLGK